MIYASERTRLWSRPRCVSDMERIRHELRRPMVWLIPLIILAIQLVGSIGPWHRPVLLMPGTPLNWFGYLLLVAGPVVLLLHTVYAYAVLLTVMAIAIGYLSVGFTFRPIFASLIMAF